MRDADIDDMGITVGGRNLTNLRYADDTALLANDITNMKDILYKVDTAGKAANLKLNAKKTKVMHVNGKATPPNIQVNNIDLEYVKNFKYLGSIKSNDGTCLQDIKTRIAMAKQKMVQLNNIWKDRGIPLFLKLKILKCLIWPVVLYGCEAWTLRKEESDKLKAAEMWFYRRLLRVSWTDKRTNESVLEELSVQRQLLQEIDRRRLRYIGHANRSTSTNLMSTVMMGKVQGKRKRGRPPTSYIGNVIDASGLTMQELVHLSTEREEWRNLVTSRGAPNVVTGEGER